MLGCPAERTEHWFGLDGNVRDVYSRVVYGTRISLVIGFLTVGVAILIGSFLGAIAGFTGRASGHPDHALMDVLLVFPALLLAIAIVTVLGPAWSTRRWPSGWWRSRSLPGSRAPPSSPPGSRTS